MIKKLFLIMLLSFACTCFATHFSAPTDVYYLKDYNNKLFFTANTPESGWELFLYENTTNTTILVDIEAGVGNSSPSNYFEFNNKIYFIAQKKGVGRELFYFDNNANNAVNVSNINPTGFAFSAISLDQGTESDNVFPHIKFNNELYFVANDGVNGNSLWALSINNEITFVGKLIDQNPEANIVEFQIVGNELFFTTKKNENSDAQYLNKLVVLNGTKSIAQIASFYELLRLTKNQNKLYFFANLERDPYHAKLWSYNSVTQQAQLVDDLQQYKLFKLGGLLSYNNKLYFTAADTSAPNNINYLWSSYNDSDKLLREGAPNFGYLPVGVYGGKLFYVLQNSEAWFQELYSFDGNNHVATGIQWYAGSPRGDAVVSRVIYDNNQLYFSLSDMRSGNLFQLNVQTNESSNFGGLETIRSPRYLVKLNDAIFYQGYEHPIGKVLFQYNLVEQVHRKVEFNINHAPIAQHDTATTFENQAIDINVVENDSDEDSDNLSLVSVNFNSGRVEIINEKIIQFIPEQDFSGTVEIEYVITDTHQAQATAIATVTVVENQAPIAVNDSVETAFNTTIEINVLANDSDPENDSLTITEASTISGSVTIIDNTKLAYTPNSGFSGTVEIEYTVVDAFMNTSSAIVSVKVSPAIVSPEKKSVSSGGALNMYLFFLLWGISLIRLNSRKYKNF